MLQVYTWLAEAATRLPRWDMARHVLCTHSCVIQEHQQSAHSGAIQAVVKACTRDLTALTLREVARHIVVPAPTEIDARGRRFASTWWMQPRGPGAELGTWIVA